MSLLQGGPLIRSTTAADCPTRGSVVLTGQELASQHRHTRRGCAGRRVDSSDSRCGTTWFARHTDGNRPYGGTRLGAACCLRHPTTGNLRCSSLSSSSAAAGADHQCVQPERITLLRRREHIRGRRPGLPTALTYATESMATSPCRSPDRQQVPVGRLSRGLHGLSFS